MATSPIVVRAVMRTLEPFSRLSLTSPIWQRILLAPSSSRPPALMLPARVDKLSGPRRSLTSQFPAWTSAVMAP